ncbi:hypothetical protein K450DRAFT_224524 [Umbelopsis ramanniana AG]|uniref:Uncharacterized protein n=1 Tax=Umbelopsis ramanniana AG TaxID=1314678 RepID=A0AAD5HG67_UMBRA|nr:uncharacterized protein K450DRAFT_224524 [Umbelopsis ramanniana AG]KAI8583170.1 hypothetical protein K450DRAFT_224524 [Umbelopsis ramanniana AG]
MSNAVHYDEENMNSDSSDEMDEDSDSIQVVTSRPLAVDYSSNDTHANGNRSSDRPRYHASTIFVSHSNGDGSGRRQIHRQRSSDSNEESTETGVEQGYFIELDDDEISDALLPDSDSELDGEDARELMEELAELHALHHDGDDDDDDDDTNEEEEVEDDEDYLPENEYHIDDDFDIIDDDDENDEDYYENDDDEEEDSSEVAYHAILRMVIQRQQQFIHRTHNPSQRQAALQKLREHDAKQRKNGGELLAKSGWFGEPDGVYGQHDVFGYRKNGRRHEISNIASNLREREMSGNYRGSRNKLGRVSLHK